METFKRTPLQLFNLPQHFVIPLFQRAYVWKEKEQWDPLWKDIRRIVELGLEDFRQHPQHFLGAVVLQAHDAGSNRVTTWNVIDGQQRLTTLQILMDATSAVLSQLGEERLSSQLESLTHNSSNFVPDGHPLFKVRHLNNDRVAFDEVMGADSPVDHASLPSADSLIVGAHQYFSTVVRQWLGNPDAATFRDRAERLASVLQTDLQLVTIELLSSENSQEIFETLNARGTPLTAADLVRNFVFQRLEAEGVDTSRAYREDWPFETKFWTKEISVGRHLVSRSSLFLNQWLVARLGEEIGPQATFNRFKSFVEYHAEMTMAELLPVIRAQAERYEAWTAASARSSGDLDVVEMAVYRMKAGGVELLKPLLIWLHEPARRVSPREIDRAVAAAESWVIRRQLLRLSSSDLGRVVADIIKTQSSMPADELGDRVVAHLARLDVASTYWPGDDEVRLALTAEPAYRRYPRARLRSILEAVENRYRAETRQPQVERSGFPIEHVLPQKWRDTWPVGSPEEEQERQDRVHRLGNLTLLTGSLNSRISNGSWSVKRAALLQHNTIKLTGRLLEQVADSAWSERAVDERTETLIEDLLAIWPVPEGHVGQVVDPQTKVPDWIEIKHLVDAGLLAPGDVLYATHRDFVGVEAAVGTDRRIYLGGTAFKTPSGAVHHLRKGASNGWYFWAVADGRRLRDLRAELLSRPGGDASS